MCVAVTMSGHCVTRWFAVEPPRTHFYYPAVLKKKKDGRKKVWMVVLSVGRTELLSLTLKTPINSQPH